MTTSISSEAFEKKQNLKNVRLYKKKEKRTKLVIEKMYIDHKQLRNEEKHLKDHVPYLL